MTEGARTAARLAFWAAGLFLVLLGALHVLVPELDPSWHFISEYEIGPYGWVMQLAFLALATSCVSLAIAVVSQVRTIGGYLGLAMLVVSAAGMVLAGIFVTEPVNAARVATTMHGRLHGIGFMLDTVPFAAVLINWSLARNVAWSSERHLLLWTAGLPLIGLAIFIVSMARMLPPPGTMIGPDVLVGWPNRILVLTHCAWILPVAWRAAQQKTS
jgi:hypothetical protein